MDDSRRTTAEDAREVTWRLLVAAGAGAAVGMLIGGLGGRLVMFVLRLASDDIVLGLQTDDSFEIGRFSTATGFLLMVTAGLGAVAGVAYLTLRQTLPRLGRAVVFGVLAALVVGADIVNSDGIDFTLLDPKPFAIASFVLIPGLAAFSIALLVDRLLAIEPWTRRPLTAVLALAALPLAPVLPALVAVGAAALGLRRAPRLSATAVALGRVVVPVAVVALAVWSGVELWRDATAIL